MGNPFPFTKHCKVNMQSYTKINKLGYFMIGKTTTRVPAQTTDSISLRCDKFLEPQITFSHRHLYFTPYFPSLFFLRGWHCKNLQSLMLVPKQWLHGHKSLQPILPFFFPVQLTRQLNKIQHCEITQSYTQWAKKPTDTVKCYCDLFMNFENFTIFFFF